VVGITESIAKRKWTKEFIKAHINLKDAVYFSFRNMKAMVFSFDVLFFLSIFVLSLVKDLRWWLWILPLLWMIVTLVYEKAVTNAATMVEGDYKIELNTFRKKVLAGIAIALIIGLIAALVYVFYKTPLERNILHDFRRSIWTFWNNSNLICNLDKLCFFIRIFEYKIHNC